MRYLHSGAVFLLCAAACFFMYNSCNSKTGSSGGPSVKKLANGGEVSGPRSAENIEKNIAILMPRLNHYYLKKLEENPGLQGTIELIFDVDADGSVIYVNLGKSTVKDPVFEDEVLAALSNHTFDVWTQGKDKTEVIYPLTFTSKKSEVSDTSVQKEEIEEATE